jgi:hypothetical protein
LPGRRSPPDVAVSHLDDRSDRRVLLDDVDGVLALDDDDLQAGGSGRLRGHFWRRNHGLQHEQGCATDEAGEVLQEWVDAHRRAPAGAEYRSTRTRRRTAVTSRRGHMLHLDTALLNATERFCQRFQMWTGRTNVWLAFQLTNLSVVLYFVWVVRLYRISQIFAARLFIAFFCVAVFFVVTRTIFKTPIDFAESQAYKRVAKGLRNPRRVRDAQLRIAFLTMSVLGSVTLSMALASPLLYASLVRRSPFLLLTGALVALTTVVLYVLACDPLPPAEGRVRAWVKNMLPSRAAEA